MLDQQDPADERADARQTSSLAGASTADLTSAVDAAIGRMSGMDATLSGTALIDWLVGVWSIDRDINAGGGTVRGTARFERQPDGALCWHECGEMRLGGGTPLSVTRTLTLDPDGQVRFDDGLPFHALHVIDGACDAFHPCGPDAYTGRYELQDDDTFSTTWHVVGPGRDDLLRTTYTRTSEPPPG